MYVKQHTTSGSSLQTDIWIPGMDKTERRSGAGVGQIKSGVSHVQRGLEKFVTSTKEG